MDTKNDLSTAFLEGLANRQRYTQPQLQDSDSELSEPAENVNAPQAQNGAQNEVRNEARNEVAPNPVLDCDDVPTENEHPIEVSEQCTKQVPKEYLPRQAPQQVQTVSNDFDERKKCLIEIRRLQSMGAHFRKTFTFDDSLVDMRVALEMARIEMAQQSNDNRNLAGVKTARRVLIAGVSMLEYANSKWSPLQLQLDGFGEHVLSQVQDYDHILERLVQKYCSGTGKMEPELELLLALGTSAVSYHVTQTILDKAMKADVPREAPPAHTSRHAEESRFDDSDTE